MTDRPILFSAPMIRALLDGRKTQTRRILKLPKWSTEKPDDVEPDDDGTPMIICKDTGCLASIPLRFAKGDRLWCRERAWYDPKVCTGLEDRGLRCFFDGRLVRFQDGSEGESPFDNTDELLEASKLQVRRPGIHMPRWASRLTLTVTDVRVQRLTDIDEIDALAEGIIRYDPTDTDDAEFLAEEGGDMYSSAVEAYEALWNRINGALAWRADPWVVALTFSVERRNIDAA